MKPISRRDFLVTTSVTAALAFSGCFTNGGDESPEVTDGTTPNSTRGSADDEENSSDEDDLPSWETVTPVIEGETQQYQADWRNTGWVNGDPIREAPTSSWDYSVGDRVSILSNGVAGDGRIYYLTDNGRLISVNSDDGEEQFDTGIGIPEAPVLGFHEGDLFVGGEINTEDFNGYVSMRDPHDGERVWDRHLTLPPEGELTTHDGTVFQADGSGELTAYEIEHGLDEWTASTNESFVGAPAVNDDVVLASTEQTLYCLDRQDGSEVWTEEINNTVTAGPVLYGDVVLVQSGTTTTVIEVETGEEVWITEPFEGTVTGIATAHDRLVAGVNNPDGNALVVVDAFTGDESWRLSITQDIIGTPIIVDDVVYLPVETGVIASDLRDGDRLWAYESEEPVTGELTISDNRIIVQSESGIQCVE